MSPVFVAADEADEAVTGLWVETRLVLWWAGAAGTGFGGGLETGIATIGSTWESTWESIWETTLPRGREKGLKT